MDAKIYAVALVGKSSRKVHRVVQSGSRTIAGQNVPTYHHECGFVNTHNINRRLSIHLLPAGTPITCERCLADIAKENAQLATQQSSAE